MSLFFSFALSSDKLLPGIILVVIQSSGGLAEGSCFDIDFCFGGAHFAFLNFMWFWKRFWRTLWCSPLAPSQRCCTPVVRCICAADSGCPLLSCCCPLMWLGCCAHERACLFQHWLGLRCESYTVLQRVSVFHWQC